MVDAASTTEVGPLEKSLGFCRYQVENYWNSLAIYRLNDTMHAVFSKETGNVQCIAQIRMNTIHSSTCHESASDWSSKLTFEIPSDFLDCHKFYQNIYRKSPSLRSGNVYRVGSECFTFPSNVILPFFTSCGSDLANLKIRPSYFYVLKRGKPIFVSPTVSQFRFLWAIKHPIVTPIDQYEYDYE